MAQELTAYFDERFREFARKIVEETAQQITASREEMSQQITASREETAQQIAELREETISRFEKGEETARHTVVLVEDLRSKLDLVAEGVIGANERLDRYRSEARIEFNQVKGWIEPYYRELDGRVRNLDNRMDCVDARLQVLEDRAERQQGDAYNAIRKMLGKPPLPPPVTSE